MTDDILLEAIDKMDKAVEHAQAQFTTVRTGRATPALVEKLMVNYYGADCPLQQLAGQAGVDMAKWEQCFDAQTHYPRIKANMLEGIRRGVAQTPTFIIGAKMIPGAVPFDEFRKYVEEAAAAARSFGGNVVLKMLSAQITHKSDIGGVAVNVPPEGIAARLDRMAADVRGATGSAPKLWKVIALLMYMAIDAAASVAMKAPLARP